MCGRGLVTSSLRATQRVDGVVDVVVDAAPVAVAVVAVVPTRIAGTEVHEPPAIIRVTLSTIVSIGSPAPVACAERVGTGVPQPRRL